MKKLSSVFCFILLFSLLLTPLCHAAGDNFDTLADWNIKIAVPDNATAVLKGNEYYIYPQHAGYIPYVMLRAYRYDNEQDFISDFTEYMQGQYSDLRVTSDTVRKTIGDKTCYEIDYTYKVSGYDVRDRRIVITVDGLTYMFASKEIESNGMTIGSTLEDVIANCVFLSAPAAEETGGLADGYLYCLENGMPKYWLDFTNTYADTPVLHCYFRSGDPTFYESRFLLDLNTAEINDEGLVIHNISDQYDFDHSNWFRKLSFQFYNDVAIMTVDRDERTLAGGAEDNILTGTYVMKPVGVSVDTAMNRAYLRPLAQGPFTAEELARWAQIDYFVETGFFPPEAEAIERADGSVTIHLYEIVDTDGWIHTATSAWYTVDAYGNGSNDITGASVSLVR